MTSHLPIFTSLVLDKYTAAKKKTARTFRHEELCFCVTGWPVELEFLETWKSEGILCHMKKVREMSGNFTKFAKVREF